MDLTVLFFSLSLFSTDDDVAVLPAFGQRRGVSQAPRARVDPA
jgi:hypothetical protein